MSGGRIIGAAPSHSPYTPYTPYTTVNPLRVLSPITRITPITPITPTHTRGDIVAPDTGLSEFSFLQEDGYVSSPSLSHAHTGSGSYSLSRSSHSLSISATTLFEGVYSLYLLL